MDLLRIEGGARLEGVVAVSGTKNAALPVMAAALLSDEPVELVNAPDIEDIGTMAEMIRHLGVDVELVERHHWRISAGTIRSRSVGAHLSRRMRGSFEHRTRRRRVRSSWERGGIPWFRRNFPTDERLRGGATAAAVLHSAQRWPDRFP